jgi:hypothetical protein
MRRKAAAHLSGHYIGVSERPLLGGVKPYVSVRHEAQSGHCQSGLISQQRGLPRALSRSSVPGNAQALTSWKPDRAHKTCG